MNSNIVTKISNDYCWSNVKKLKIQWLQGGGYDDGQNWWLDILRNNDVVPQNNEFREQLDGQECPIYADLIVLCVMLAQLL